MSSFSYDNQWVCDICGGRPLHKMSRANHLKSIKHLNASANLVVSVSNKMCKEEKEEKERERQKYEEEERKRKEEQWDIAENELKIAQQFVIYSRQMIQKFSIMNEYAQHTFINAQNRIFEMMYNDRII